MQAEEDSPKNPGEVDTPEEGNESNDEYDDTANDQGDEEVNFHPRHLNGPEPWRASQSTTC